VSESNEAALARARVTFGQTVDETITMAREAVEVYIKSLRERGEEVPTEEGCLEYGLTVEVPGRTPGPHNRRVRGYLY